MVNLREYSVPIYWFEFFFPLRIHSSIINDLNCIRFMYKCVVLLVAITTPVHRASETKVHHVLFITLQE